MKSTVAIAAGFVTLAFLLVVQQLTPWAAFAATGSSVVLVSLVVSGRRFGYVHDRLSTLEHLMRGADAGIIGLEQAQEPVRVLGDRVEVQWNRGTITPDLANHLVQMILLRRPERVIECGAGVSTKVIARAL